MTLIVRFLLSSRQHRPSVLIDIIPSIIRPVKALQEIQCYQLMVPTMLLEQVLEVEDGDWRKCPHCPCLPSTRSAYMSSHIYKNVRRFSSRVKVYIHILDTFIQVLQLYPPFLHTQRKTQVESIRSHITNSIYILLAESLALPGFYAEFSKPHLY